MLATNITNLRDNMKEYFDKAADSFEPLIVTRKGENMVVLPQSLYDSMMETLYLMSSDNNREHLKKSLEQYKSSQYTEHSLHEEL